MRVNSSQAQKILDEGVHAVTSGGYYFFSDGHGYYYYLAYGNWPDNIRACARMDLEESFSDRDWTVVEKGSYVPIE